MSSWTKAFLITLLCTFSVLSFGQSDEGVLVKKLFVDYKSPETGDVFDFREWRSGFEMGYLRKLNDKLTLVVPFKVAVVQHSDSLTNDFMFALEAQIQYELISGKTWSPYLATGAGLVIEDFNDAHAAIPAMLGC